MGDRPEMRVDPLEVAQEVQVQGRCLAALAVAFAQADQVALRRLAFEIPDLDLLLHHLAGQVTIAGHEDGLRDAKCLLGHQEHGVQFLIPGVREAQPQADLPAHPGRQPLFDDVADMFQVDHIVEDRDGPTAVILIGVATQRAEHFGFDEGGKLRIGFDSGARDKFGHGTPRAIVERRCRTRGGAARSMPPAVDLCKARAGLAQRQD